MINQMSLKQKRKNIKNFTARNLNKIKLVTTIYMAQSYANRQITVSQGQWQL
jgi:hypothetical protein